MKCMSAARGCGIHYVSISYPKFLAVVESRGVEIMCCVPVLLYGNFVTGGKHGYFLRLWVMGELFVDERIISNSVQCRGNRSQAANLDRLSVPHNHSQSRRIHWLQLSVPYMKETFCRYLTLAKVNNTLSDS